MRRLALGLLGIMLVLGTAVARAEEPPAVDVSVARPRGKVKVRLVGALGRDETLKQRIASWFEPESFAVTVESVSYLDPRQVLAPERGALVEAWVTRRDEQMARLYFASSDGHSGVTRYLLRDLRLEAGLDELGAEELSQAVHWSTVALLEGQQVSTRAQVERSLQAEPESPPAVATTAPPKAARARSETASVRDEATAPPSSSRGGAAPFELNGAVGYAVLFRGDEGVAHGPRARVRVGFTPTWGLAARCQLMLPYRRELPSLNLDLYGGSALLAAGFRAQMSRLFVIEGFAGASLELAHYAPGARPGVALTLGPAATELRPGLAFGALLVFGSAPRLALVPELLLGLREAHYDLERAGKREVVARSALLTPSLGLELEL